MPDFRAKRVWSLPMPTFVPGNTLVPLCLEMMSPTLAKAPSVILIPRYLGLESRPFLVVPVAFLCAIMMLV